MKKKYIKKEVENMFRKIKMNYRRLNYVYERKIKIYESFMYIALIDIIRK